MIIVLDTSVIVSALLSPSGPPAKIISFWEEDKFDVVVSPPLISELERVLKYPRITRYLKWTEEKTAAFLRRYAAAAILVEPQSSLMVIHADPTDNRVIECAVAGRASFVITGDSHLLDIKECQGIVILSPAGFINYLLASEPHV